MFRRVGGQKHYAIKVRICGRQRHVTIGAHGSPWTVETARKEAVWLLGQIASGQDVARVRDHAKTIPTVAQAIQRFMEEHVGAKLKPRTAANYEFMIRLHILPAFGRDRLDAIGSSDISKLHHKMRATAPTANRCLAALSKFFSWAETQNLRPRASNPCVGLDKFRERKRERFLSDPELAKLGHALVTAECAGKSPYFLALIRLLILTGARHDESKTLEWSMVDLRRGLLSLPESKTGAKTIVLNAPALDVLVALPRQEGNPFVMCGEVTGKHLINARKPWLRLLTAAGIDGPLRVHDLRHSFASVAMSEGGSLPMIGRLLGHSQPQTTQRYAHLAADPARALAEQSGASLTARMNARLAIAETKPLRKLGKP